LIEIGRKHARNFDAGHHPSGNSAARVLAELRKLAAKRASAGDSKTATLVKSELDRIREHRASRLAGAQD
jgi:pyruvate-formate lyase